MKNITLSRGGIRAARHPVRAPVFPSDPPGRRKSQTRRAVRIDDTPITAADVAKLKRQKGIPSDAQNVRFLGEYVKCDAPPGSHTVSARVPCPYGDVGDTLRVRERWAVAKEYDRQPPSALGDVARQQIWYEADEEPGTAVDPRRGRWRSHFYMPSWAYRLTITLLRIRVQRLQDITESDALAEGIETFVFRPDDGFPLCTGYGTGYDNHAHATPIDAFRALWDSINADRGFPWDDNPYVWVLDFEMKELDR